MKATLTPVSQKAAKPLRIAVLGLESSPFWIPVKAGVERAGRELAPLGATVEWIVPGEQHTADVFGRGIDAALAKQYDAIATIAGDAGVAAYIDRASQAGSPGRHVQFRNRNAERAPVLRRRGQLRAGNGGGRVDVQARRARTEKSGSSRDFFAVEAHQARVKGFEDALKKGCPRSSVVGMVENQDKAENAYQQAKDFMTAHADLGGIIAIAGSPFGAARAVDEVKKAGKVHLVTFDAVDETLDYVDKGVIDATIGQDPDAQGHDPVIRLYNYLVAGQVPPYGKLLTKAEMITKENSSKFRAPK